MAQFKKLPRDSSSDCPACEADACVQFALRAEDYPGALAAGAKIIAGTQTCAEAPHLTMGPLALWAELNGDSAKAANFDKKGCRLILGNAEFLGASGYHMSWAAAAGQADKGLRMLMKHAAWLEANGQPSSHLEFLLGATAVCRMLAAQHAAPAFRLQLPAKLSRELDGSPQPAAVWAERFYSEGLQLARSYDQRNQNTWRSQHFLSMLDRIEARRASRGEAEPA